VNEGFNRFNAYAILSQTNDSLVGVDLKKEDARILIESNRFQSYNLHYLLRSIH